MTCAAAFSGNRPSTTQPQGERVMKAKRILQLLSLATFCLLLTSCFDSKVPLSDASTAKQDDRLIGLWQHRHQNGVTYYHVGRLGDKAPEGMMRVVTVTQQDNGELQEPHQLIRLALIMTRRPNYCGCFVRGRSSGLSRSTRKVMASASKRPKMPSRRWRRGTASCQRVEVVLVC